MSLSCIAPSDIEFALAEAHKLLAKMPNPYARVLRGRFFDGKTLEAIGMEMSLSRARIGQLEKHALLKLRRHYVFTQNYRYSREGNILREALDVLCAVGEPISKP